MAIGIIIIPPFITILIREVAPGEGCVGSAGEDTESLFSVSIVCDISIKIGVMAVSLYSNEVIVEKLFIFGSYPK